MRIKSVPVVVRENGKKVKVGTAVVEVSDDGSYYVTAKIDAECIPTFAVDIKQFSIGPMRPPTNHKE